MESAVPPLQWSERPRPPPSSIATHVHDFSPSVRRRSPPRDPRLHPPLDHAQPIPTSHSQHVSPIHLQLPAPQGTRHSHKPQTGMSTSASSIRKCDSKRKTLMRTRVIPLDEFTQLRARKLKMEKAEGEAVVPIPVPLKPGESEREYEAAMHKWLQGRGVFLKDLRDEPLRERTYRNAYADLRAKSTDHDHYQPPKSKSGGKSDYEARRGATHDGRREGYARKRSLSPHSDNYDRPPHKVYVEHHSQQSSSSRDHQYHGYSTASRRSPSMSSPSERAKQCRAQLPAANSSFWAFVAAYVECYCFDCLRDWNSKLTDRLEALETNVRDLRKRVSDDPTAVEKSESHQQPSSQVTENVSPKEPGSSGKAAIDGIKNPSSINAGTDDQQQEPITKAAAEAASRSVSTSSSFKSTSASIDAQCVSENDGEAKSDLEGVDMGPALSAASGDSRSLIPPTAASSTAQSCTSSDPVTTASTHNAMKQVGGDTSDAEATPSTETQSANSERVQVETQMEYQAAANPTDYVAADISAQGPIADPSAHQLMTEKSLDELMIERSVKAQMTSEYDSLNQQILNNEKILQDAVEQLQQRMVTDMHGALRQQEQIQQLRQSIFDDMGHRDAAMAMLIAYCWVGKHDELMDRITQLDTLDVPHVQRVGHIKCAELASQIAERAVEISLWQTRLAAATMANDGDGSGTVDNLRLVEDVKSQIAHVEAELATLEEERMEQFMRLFQFSHRIRATCKSMLET